MRWFASTWTFWSSLFDLIRGTAERFYKVKAWYQCRSCRTDNAAVVRPYCYKTFEVTGDGLGRLHAQRCPKAYPFRLRHHGPFSVRTRRESRYQIQILTATTRELREKDIIRL